MTEGRVNALDALLRTRSTARSPADYERMFDDFVVFAGGGRVGDRFELPGHVKNPDYHFAFDHYDLLVELKQVSAYRPADTIDAWFNKLLRTGRIRLAIPPAGERLWIEPDSLSKADWAHFYGKFRPSVTKHLTRAAQQLKQTDMRLPAPRVGPRLCGLMLINTGDYNLSLDLMFRLVEWRVKREWHRGHFSKLDFVSCLTVDFAPRPDQHPLQGHHILRPSPHPLLGRAVWYLYDRWLRYFADAIGATVDFLPDAGAAEPPYVLGGGYRGKIQRLNEP